MKAPKHVPAIGADFAGCRCGKWNGPTRRPDETQGQYTRRAYEAHAEHARDPQPPLYSMTEFLMEDLRR